MSLNKIIKIYLALLILNITLFANENLLTQDENFKWISNGTNTATVIMKYKFALKNIPNLKNKDFVQVENVLVDYTFYNDFEKKFLFVENISKNKYVRIDFLNYDNYNIYLCTDKKCDINISSIVNDYEEITGIDNKINIGYIYKNFKKEMKENVFNKYKSKDSKVLIIESDTDSLFDYNNKSFELLRSVVFDYPLDLTTYDKYNHVQNYKNYDAGTKYNLFDVLELLSKKYSKVIPFDYFKIEKNTLLYFGINKKDTIVYKVTLDIKYKTKHDVNLLYLYIDANSEKIIHSDSYSYDINE